VVREPGVGDPSSALSFTGVLGLSLSKSLLLSASTLLTGSSPSNHALAILLRCP